MTAPAGPRVGRSVVRVDPSDWTVHPLLDESLRRPIDVCSTPPGRSSSSTSVSSRCRIGAWRRRPGPGRWCGRSWGSVSMADDRGSGAGSQSTGELVSRLGHQVGELVSKEMQLARVELREEVVKGVKATAALSGSALVGLVALVFVSSAAAWGLAEVMAPGWAFLVVAAVQSPWPACSSSSVAAKPPRSTPCLTRRWRR
jgi:uncharacterized membrane protein YqjE